MEERIEPQEWRFDSKGYRSRIEKDTLVVRYEENGHGLLIRLVVKPPSQVRLLPAVIQVKDAEGKDITDVVNINPSIQRSPRPRWLNILSHGRKKMQPVVQKVTERSLTLTPEQVIAIMDHLISLSPKLRKDAFEKWGLDQPDVMDDRMPPESDANPMDEPE